MTHFTYVENPDLDILCQGDILERSDELDEVFKLYHPHYKNKEYTHFQVLTQSCDLVRRNGNDCSSRYITLAAVRNYDTVIKRYLSEELSGNKILDVGGEYWCSESIKSRLSGFIESLFNNNDKKYFFLNEWKEVGLLDDSCTFLHLSVALKASEHYDKCLRAKKIQLEGSFQAKLGWLVGNLYSRVGTEDFVPGRFAKKSDFQNHINDVILKHVYWVKPENYPMVRKEYVADTSLQIDELIEKVTVKKQENRDVAQKQFSGKISKLLKLEDSEKELLENFLKSGNAKQFLADKLT